MFRSVYCHFCERAPFLMICGVFFLLGTSGTGVLTHLIPMITDHGISAGTASKIAGLAGLSTLVSRGVVGWLLDRTHAPYMVGGIACLCAGMCLLLVRGGGSGVYSVAAVLLGLIAGAEVDFIGFLVRKYFGTAVFGRLYAVAFAAFALGPGAAVDWVQLRSLSWVSARPPSPYRAIPGRGTLSFRDALLWKY